MKKVCHLITGLELGGGAENMLLQLLPRLRDHGFENTIIVVKGRGEIGRRLEAIGMDVRYLDYSGLASLPRVIRTFRCIARERNPDIQVNYLIHADIFGRILGQACRIPKIVSYVRNVHRLRKDWLFLDFLTLPLVDRVVFNSQAAQNYYQRNLFLKEEKAFCIPNGVDTQRFDPDALSSEDARHILSLPLEITLITAVARLEKQKDLPTLLRAFSQLVGSGERRLLIVGSGKEKGNLVALAQELSLSEKVLFWEKRSDMETIYAASDIFVLPSLQEGMSNAIMEAMAMRKIIIVSDIPENQELITHEKTGITFPAGNASALAAALSEIEQSLDEYCFLAEAAHREADEKYSIDSIAFQYAEFLRSL